MLSNSKTIIINSSNRSSGTHSDFTFTYQKEPNENYTHAVLVGCSIPISYPLVQDGYNVFTLHEDGKTADITVTVGNYYRSSFLQHVKSLLNTYSPNGWTYNISIPNEAKEPDTGRYTFSVSGNSSVQPAIEIIDDNLSEQFGLNSGINTFVADSLVSTNVVNFVNEQTLLIHSNLIDGKASGNNYVSVLQDVYISNNLTFSCGVFQCPDIINYGKPINPTRGNSISIRLTNEAGVILDLQGRNALYTIMLFNKHEIFDTAQNLIKYIVSEGLKSK